MDEERFSVGDIVLVKEWEEMFEEYIKDTTRLAGGYGMTLPSGVFFAPDMRVYCGGLIRVVEVRSPGATYPRYVLEGCEGWVFTSEMITKNYIDNIDDGDVSLDFTALF